MSVVARVDGDHFELPVDALELLRQVRPADQQWFIEEVTQALAVAADTKDFGPAVRRSTRAGGWTSRSIIAGVRWSTTSVARLGIRFSVGCPLIIREPWRLPCLPRVPQFVGTRV